MNDQVDKAKEQSRAEDVDNCVNDPGPEVKARITMDDWERDCAGILLDNADMSELNRTVVSVLEWRQRLRADSWHSFVMGRRMMDLAYVFCQSLDRSGVRAEDLKIEKDSENAQKK